MPEGDPEIIRERDNSSALVKRSTLPNRKEKGRKKKKHSYMGRWKREEKLADPEVRLFRVSGIRGEENRRLP